MELELDNKAHKIALSLKKKLKFQINQNYIEIIITECIQRWLQYDTWPQDQNPLQISFLETLLLGTPLCIDKQKALFHF